MCTPGGEGRSCLFVGTWPPTSADCQAWNEVSVLPFEWDSCEEGEAEEEPAKEGEESDPASESEEEPDGEESSDE